MVDPDLLLKVKGRRASAALVSVPNFSFRRGKSTSVVFLWENLHNGEIKMIGCNLFRQNGQMRKRKALNGNTCFQVTGISKADDSDQLE